MHRIVSLTLVVGALVLGCGGGSSSGSGSSSGAAAVEPVGNAAVTARIASVPAPPIPWSTQFSAITPAQADVLCPWAATNVRTTEVNETCPDGSNVHIGAGCETDGLMQMVTQLGQAQCSMTVAEYMGCLLAMRADPCGAGPFGSNAPECEAMTGCIRAAFAAAQSAQQGQ
ncbi:MAG: hypothetical protein K1X94_29455 [Sandaracinaceae bacterium]|nr:hypothetical protein [Sandaracinaceae bacterium]